nr:zinc finger, CCHC-type [Tanacetum cinerariifolium]
MQKVAEDVGEDDDFNSEAWFSATNYVIATGGTVIGCLKDINNFQKKGKLEQVVAIVKSCSPNVLGDLNVTMKDLSGTIPRTVHHKVIGDGGYEKDITVYYVTCVSEAYFVKDDDVAWWVDSGATVHVCKDRCWFNIVNNNIGSAFMSTSKQNDSILWHARLGHVYFKRMQDMSKDGLILAFDMDTKKCERNTECIFVGYAKHSKAFLFFVIEPNDSVSINSTIESRDEIFDENSLSSVPKPSLRIPNGTKDIGSSVVPEKVTEEFVQQPKPELRKSKRNRTSKNHGPEFQLYLIERTRDEVSDQHSYCFNVEDDPKKFDEAMKSQDVVFWKEATNDEIDSIMGNNTWVLTDLPPDFLNDDLDEEIYMNQPQGFIMFGNENKVNLTKEFLSSRFSMKDMGEADVILDIRIKHEMSTPMDTSEKLMSINGQAVYCNHGTQHWQVIQRDNSSTSGWVFLLGGGAISWSSKKQSCITGSTMEYEFVALADAGNEVEWLRNLILEISLWETYSTYFYPL